MAWVPSAPVQSSFSVTSVPPNRQENRPTAMRAGASTRPRPSAAPGSPFRNLRAARMARLEVLHLRRLEMRRAALASLFG